MLPVRIIATSHQATLAVTSHCHLVSLLNTGLAQSRDCLLTLYKSCCRAQILPLLPRCHQLGLQAFTSLIPCLYAQTLIGKNQFHDKVAGSALATWLPVRLEPPSPHRFCGPCSKSMSLTKTPTISESLCVLSWAIPV